MVEMKSNEVHSLVHLEDYLLLRQPRCRLPAAETLLQIKFDKSTGSVSWCAADVTEKSHVFRVVLSAPDWPSHLLLPPPPPPVLDQDRPLRSSSAFSCMMSLPCAVVSHDAMM